MVAMENPTNETSVGTQNGPTTNKPARARSIEAIQKLHSRARAARGVLRRERAERLPRVVGLLKNRPLIGVGLAIGSGLGLAAVIGAAETAVALSAGVLAYQTLTRH